MAVDGVSSNFEVTPSEYTEGKAKVSSLGKDEFLNLLVTQLQYQDPLEPSNDTEFIAQMAQFSSLEQMQNLNNTFSSFMSYSLVGKYATAEYGTGSIEGYIESIVNAGDTTYAVIDGTSVDIDDIYKVTDVAEELQVLVNILNELVKGNEGSEGSTEEGDKTENIEGKVDNVEDKTEDVTTE